MAGCDLLWMERFTDPRPMGDLAALSGQLTNRAAAAVITGALSKRCRAIARTGSPWRDLPLFVGNWNSASSATATGSRLALHLTVRGLLRRAGYGIRHGRCHHRQSPSPRSGRKGGRRTRRSAAPRAAYDYGNTGATHALGNLVLFVLLPGHRFDTVGVAPLIDGIAFGGSGRQPSLHSNAIIANLNERGDNICDPHRWWALPLRLDTELYKWRHLIENFFCKLKEFKRIAMRADKTDQSFAAIIHLAQPVQNHDESQQALERVTNGSDRQQIINLLAEERQKQKDAGDFGLIILVNRMPLFSNWA